MHPDCIYTKACNITPVSTCSSTSPCPSEFSRGNSAQTRLSEKQVYPKVRPKHHIPRVYMSQCGRAVHVLPWSWVSIQRKCAIVVHPETNHQPQKHRLAVSCRRDPYTPNDKKILGIKCRNFASLLPVLHPLETTTTASEEATPIRLHALGRKHLLNLSLLLSCSAMLRQGRAGLRRCRLRSRLVVSLGGWWGRWVLRWLIFHLQSQQIPRIVEGWRHPHAARILWLVHHIRWGLA